MSQEHPIKFRINDFQIEEFAVIPGVEPVGKTFDITVGIQWLQGAKPRVVGNRTEITFSTLEKQPMVVLKVDGTFIIDSESWAKLYDKNRGVCLLPKMVAEHLAVITVGVARGILVAKLQNQKSRLSELVLPAIDVRDFIPGDIQLESRISEEE